MKRLISTIAFYFIVHFAFGQFEYISPLPGTERHNPETNIILKNGNIIDAASVRDHNLIQIKGSKSGLHSWTAQLSDDNKTVVIKPDPVFEPGDEVIVKVNAKLKTKDGETINGTTFSFKIRDDLSSHVQQQVRGDISTNIKARGNNLNRYPKAAPAVLLQGPPPFTININSNPAVGTLFYGSHQKDDDAGYSYDAYLNRIDNKGHILWYRDIGDLQGNDFKINANGYLTYFNQYGSWFIILDSNFNKIDSIRAGNGYGNQTSNHDCMMYPDGHTFLLIYDNEIMDLTQYGGKANATVQVPIIQELDANRDVVFQWRSLDYFKISDANANLNILASPVQPVHTNAIWRDSTDGNIVISNRNMSEITKIDINTGNIIWRLGGKNNQFTFKNDVDSMHFDSQHDVQQIANGDITLFNNANEFPVQQSSAKEYRLDQVNKIATYVWSYKHPDVNGVHVFGDRLGSVQRLSNGNTLIGWGDIQGKTDETKIPNFTEVDSSNAIVWEFTYDSSDINTYRVHRYNWNPCSRVTSYTMKTTNIKNQQATLNWQSAAGATSYKVRFHRATVITWSTIYVSDTTLTLTGLKKNTAYQWEVSTVCDKKNNTVNSGFSAPLSFMTTGLNKDAAANTDENDADDVISIYPLPAREYIHLHFTSSVTGTVEIFDEVGKIVYKEFVNADDGETEVIETRNWTPGVYFVKMDAKDHNIMKKISVQ